MYEEGSAVGVASVVDSGRRRAGRSAMSKKLDGRRAVDLRKAYAIAVDHCLSALLQREPLSFSIIRRLTLRDLPDGPAKAELLRCRVALGLSMCPNSRVLVDADHERK